MSETSRLGDRIAGDARGRAARAARAIIATLVASDLSDARAELVAAELERVARELEPHTKSSRYEDPEVATAAAYERGGAALHEDHELFRTHPLVGRWHPLAPPLKMRSLHPVPVAEVTYGVAYEGMPGLVHGGFIALAFDYITVLTAFLHDAAGVTGSLQVKYRRPVPLGVVLEYSAEPVRTSGRSMIVRGRLDGPDGLCAEAETLVITPRH
ncbi:MAG: PaaI family thioesterase [Acidimicrobiia bacterium]